MASSPRSHPSARPATEADVDTLASLWAFAFPGERTADVRARELREGGPWGGWEDAWIVGEPSPGGRIDGAFRALPLTLHLFGRPVPTLGVAAVAVAPHARRQGLGAHLTREALRVGVARGDLLSALYPFRTDFYARLGYALAGALHRYRFPPEALPPFPGAERIVRVEDPLTRLPPLHAAFGDRIQGLIARGPKLWEALLDAAPLAFGIRGENAGRDTLAGYLLGSVRRMRGGKGAAFRIAELLAPDPDAYRAALGWISAQRDAWREVTLDALPGERLHQVLAHPRLPGAPGARKLWFPSATILRGPMVRILQVGALLEHLGADPGTDLSVEDAELPANRGRWVVEGPERRVRKEEKGGPRALPVALASGLLVEGELPGLRLPRPDFHPALGLGDFRLLDAF